MPKYTFLLYLKESEFRFNHRDENLYKLLLKLLRQLPLYPNLLLKPQSKTPAAGESGRRYEKRLAATDSPTGEGSTIGAPGLNGSVRNGKR